MFRHSPHTSNDIWLILTSIMRQLPSLHSGFPSLLKLLCPLASHHATICLNAVFMKFSVRENPRGDLVSSWAIRSFRNNPHTEMIPSSALVTLFNVSIYSSSVATELIFPVSIRMLWDIMSCLDLSEGGILNTYMTPIRHIKL